MGCLICNRQSFNDTGVCFSCSKKWITDECYECNAEAGQQFRDYCTARPNTTPYGWVSNNAEGTSNDVV